MLVCSSTACDRGERVVVCSADGNEEIAPAVHRRRDECAGGGCGRHRGGRRVWDQQVDVIRKQHARRADRGSVQRGHSGGVYGRRRAAPRRELLSKRGLGNASLVDLQTTRRECVRADSRRAGVASAVDASGHGLRGQRDLRPTDVHRSIGGVAWDRSGDRSPAIDWPAGCRRDGRSTRGSVVRWMANGSRLATSRRI